MLENVVEGWILLGCVEILKTYSLNEILKNKGDFVGKIILIC